MILCVSLNPALDKMLKLNSIKVGKVNRASLESVHAGGKAINVAVDLRLQGDPSYVTGFVGGMSGKKIAEELKEKKLPFRFVFLGTETRTNMNYIDAAGNVTEILEGGHLVDAKSEEEFLHLYRTLLAKAEMVVLSGSLPSGLGSDFYGILTTMANREGIPVCLDTSGEALANAVSHAPFLIKPNLSELENLTSHKYDLTPLDNGFDAFFEMIALFNSKPIKLPRADKIKKLLIVAIAYYHVVMLGIPPKEVGKILTDKLGACNLKQKSVKAIVNKLQKELEELGSKYNRGE